VAGAAGGGYAGNRIQKNLQDRDTTTTTEQKCATVYDTAEHRMGYEVRYRLNGQEATVKMDHDPGERIPVQTIAPKFTGRFNKGVDYVGSLAQFEKEFDENLSVIALAIREFGLGFLYAPAAHAAARHAGPARREIGKRTVFNLLGPLTNPAGAEAQVPSRSALAVTRATAATC